MMDKKIYLHIGFNKSGSSALQAFLSLNPEFKASVFQENFLYCVFNPDGSISSRKKIAGLTTSLDLSYSAIFKTADLSKTKHDLDNIFSAGYTPIFSHEDWGLRFSEFEQSNFFIELGCSAHLIVYVRPQVEWLNSAWWQWFAWGSHHSPKDVLGISGCDHILWADYIEKWKNVPGVKSVAVRLLDKDIIEDFMNLLSIPKNPEIKYPARINVGLSPTHIKLLMRNPEIRGVHGAEVDGIFSEILHFDGSSPWVIDKELIGEVISVTHTGNLKLLSMLDESSRKVMENDSRWWSPEFYSKRHPFSKKDMELDKEELLAIADQIMPAVIRVVRVRDYVVEERDHVVRELGYVVEERDHLMRERDHLIRERDHLVRERDKLLNSISWKITQPLRRIKSWWIRH